jgi:hypothetical protein
LNTLNVKLEKKSKRIKKKGKKNLYIKKNVPGFFAPAAVVARPGASDTSNPRLGITCRNTRPIQPFGNLGHLISTTSIPTHSPVLERRTRVTCRFCLRECWQEAYSGCVEMRMLALGILETGKRRDENAGMLKKRRTRREASRDSTTGIRLG